MKRCIALLLLALLLAGCTAEPAYTGEKVTKTVMTENNTYWSPWEGEVSSHWRYVSAYDIYGNCAITYYYKDDELSTKTVMTYDERGNLLTSQEYDCEGWLDLPSEHTELTYDDQGRPLTETHTWFLSFEKDVTTHVYDDEARSKTTTYSSGLVCTYWYDEAGNVIRMLQQEPEYTIDTVYTYDENGNEILQESTCTGMEYGVSVQSRSYDENGNLLLTEITQDGELFHRAQYEYDDQGRQIHYASFYADDGIFRDIRWSYEDGCETRVDQDGDRRVTWYDENGRIQYIEDYDRDGNQTMTQTFYYDEIKIIPREEG